MEENGTYGSLHTIKENNESLSIIRMEGSQSQREATDVLGGGIGIENK